MFESSYYVFFAKRVMRSSKAIRIQSLLETKKGANVNNVTTVGIYLHGFPDSGVRPIKSRGELRLTDGLLPLVDVESAKVVHGSRMSSKMSEAFLSSSDGDNLAYCSFNTNGVPNSDGDFYDKTLIKDVADLEAVTSWLREHLRSLERIFLIGFSTGAFLSVCAPVMTNVVSEKSRALLKGVISIACLSDPHIGAKLDFNQEQITACQETGECLVKFWPLLEVEVNVGTGEVMNNKGIEEASKPEPVEWRLSRAYYDSYLDLPARTEITKHWPEKLPLLLVHGTGDVLVPNEMSAELQKAFPVDTTVTRITVAGANHFFSSQKDMKKLQLAVKNFCHDLNAQTTSSL